ncbi:MAG: hypothetical protein JJE40_16970 [Vicinamibacteria bacterium]|nr:hypothetical protein [Vicinamibacteria bacterium]
MTFRSSSSSAASRFGPAARVVAGGLGLAAAGYATWAGLAWYRYGQASKAKGDAADPLLDHFMPEFEVVERHHLGIAAPAEVVLAAAKEQNLIGSPVVRAIFKTRALVMGATPAEVPAHGLLSQVLALGWGVLADTPGEMVLGAVARPWEADVAFKAVPPDEFAGFNEPGYVKIIWSLRADPVSSVRSVFRTETRATATDPLARTKFRRYWALSSAGIALIRLLSLPPLKADAERRWREATHVGEPVAATR